MGVTLGEGRLYSIKATDGIVKVFDLCFLGWYDLGPYDMYLVIMSRAFLVQYSILTNVCP